MAQLQNKSTFAGVRITGKSRTGYAYSQLIQGFGYAALGCSAFGTYSSGIFIGYRAGLRMCSAYSVIAIGSEVFCSAANITSIGNTVAIGKNVAKGRCNFCNVVAIGYNVLNHAYSGNNQRNVIIGSDDTGRFSGGTNYNNTIIGNKVARCLPTCANTIIGFCAGNSNSYVLGAKNTLIGNRAGQQLTTDAYDNVMIGSRAGESMAAARINTIVIGYANAVSENNHTVIGNANTTRNVAPRSWTIISDSRDKTDVVELEKNLGLNFIRKLKPISYRFNHRRRYVQGLGYEYGESDGSLKDSKESYGFSAQQIKTTLEELSITFDALKYNTSDDSYRLIYTELISPIVKSIQETILRLERVEKLTEEKYGML
jgi:trimeric autotransporter adhesin